MRDIFARHGADPQGDSIIRARFCPECQSTRQNQKTRSVTISCNPSTGRWTWTCQHCHSPGTRHATGDAIEAEKRFRGIRGELVGRDFVALAEELAGGAAPARTVRNFPAPDVAGSDRLHRRDSAVSLAV